MRFVTACMSLVTLALLSGCAENLPTDDEYLGDSSSALITENAIFENALMENALMENALMENALMENALMENALEAIHDPSEVGALNRELLKYIVACAFKSQQSFDFSWTDEANVVHNEHFIGQLGIAPQWATGPLDISGQHMVSACLAAKVNHYGVHVTLSARSEKSPLRLSPNSPELTDYSKVEGAFWGNLWAPQPYINACYNSANVDNSRAHMRDCAAGHLEQDGSVSECGIINIMGSCSSVCKKYNASRGYYEDCRLKPGSNKRTDLVITTALP